MSGFKLQGRRPAMLEPEPDPARLQTHRHKATRWEARLLRGRDGRLHAHDAFNELLLAVHVVHLQSPAGARNAPAGGGGERGCMPPTTPPPGNERLDERDTITPCNMMSCQSDRDTSGAPGTLCRQDEQNGAHLSEYAGARGETVCMRKRAPRTKQLPRRKANSNKHGRGGKPRECAHRQNAKSPLHGFQPWMPRLRDPTSKSHRAKVGSCMPNTF